MNHEVELVTSGPRTNVIIDGIDIDAVVSYSVNRELQELYRVTFTILAENVRIYEELPPMPSEEDLRDPEH